MHVNLYLFDNSGYESIVDIKALQSNDEGGSMAPVQEKEYLFQCEECGKLDFSPISAFEDNNDHGQHNNFCYIGCDCGHANIFNLSEFRVNPSLAVWFDSKDDPEILICKNNDCKHELVDRNRLISLIRDTGDKVAIEALNIELDGKSLKKKCIGCGKINIFKFNQARPGDLSKMTVTHIAE
jgi:hypothetical protein